MGFTPAQVGEMSLWEFVTCWDGWFIANCGEPDLPPPTPEQHQYLIDKYG